MKTIQSILMFAVLVYAGECAADNRPDFAALAVKHQNLLTTWLNQDCRVDSGEIEADMISAGAVLEAALWEAIKRGPTEEARADLQNSLAERYALRLRWLMHNGADAVEPRLSKQLLAQSEAEFRATESEKLVNRWSDAAVAGLGVVCTDRSLEGLRVIANDDGNPSSIAAGAALKASGNCRAR